MADPKTIRDLQRYIYKRPQGQSAEQVYAHIDKVHSRDPLSAGEWDALVGSACSNPDAAVVQWLIDRGARPAEQLTELMRATVGSRESRLAWIDRRIEVLGILAAFCPKNDKETLSKTLWWACWFGNIGPAAWLIQQGADIRYAEWNASRDAEVDCMVNAEIYGERSGDFALRDYLLPWHQDGLPLGDWRRLYDGDA